MKKINTLLMCLPLLASAQQTSLSIDEAVAIGLKNNPGVRAATQQVLYNRQLRKTSLEIPKTEINLLYGQYNSIVKDKNIMVLQSIPFLTVFSSRSALANAQIKVSETRKAITENELIFRIKETCYRLLYIKERGLLLKQQDSLFGALAKVATRKYQAGEGTKLEMTKALAQQSEARNVLNENSADREIYEAQLQALVNSADPMSINKESLRSLPFPNLSDSLTADDNANVQYMKQQVSVADNQKRLDLAQMMPEINLGFFNQTLVGVQNINGQDQYFGREKRFTGLQIGLGIPLWFAPHTARVKASDYNKKSAEAEFEQAKINWFAQTRAAYQQATKYKASLDYYMSTGLPMAESIQQQALQSFKQGEMDFTTLLLNTNQSVSIKEAYWQNLLEYNLAIIQIEFLTAQKR